jgi:hypothetical protein
MFAVALAAAVDGLAPKRVSSTADFLLGLWLALDPIWD